MRKEKLQRINNNLIELEMGLEREDDIAYIQYLIKMLCVDLKNSKNVELRSKLDNLINYFRKVYLGQ